VTPSLSSVFHRCAIPTLLVPLWGCDGSDSHAAGEDAALVPVVENPAEAGWTLQPQPDLTEELRIGAQDGDPAYQLSAVVAIDVDDAGRIYVLDQQAAQVRMYDAGGRHLRTLGRPGMGPGELSTATAAVLASSGVVYVADLLRQRIVAFGEGGSEIGSSPLLMQAGVPIRWQPTAQHRFALQVRTVDLPGAPAGAPQKDRILLRDPASERADTLLELASGGTFQSGGPAGPRLRFFEPEPVWTLLQDGGIAHGRNDELRVKVLAPDGALRLVITRPMRRPRVTEADRAAFLETIRRSLERPLGGGAAAAEAIRQFVDRVEFAAEYPAYAGMFGGPANSLWVQRIRTAADARASGTPFDAQDVGAPVWDVFDARGRLLGPIRLPDRFTPLRVRQDWIYGTIRDDMDVLSVLRLRVAGLGRGDRDR
jgi:hypothetical protein